MNIFNLRETVNKALNQLALYDLSEKTLKAYRYTGFGNLIRYYEKSNIAEIDMNMLDTYLYDMHLAHKAGIISHWKWDVLRRSCELLRCFVKNGTVEMKPLRSWNYWLGRPNQSIVFDMPTSEQLNNPDNIFALTWKVRQRLKEYGLAERSICHYTSEGLTVILRKHYELGTEIYSKEITDNIVIAKRKKFEAGTSSRRSYQNLRKAAFMIDEMHKTGNIVLRTIPNYNIRILENEYANLLTDFCDYLRKEKNTCESSVNTLRSAVRCFLLDLEHNGIHSAKQLELLNVNNSVTRNSVYYPCGAGNFLYAVRLFLKYLFVSGHTDCDYSLTLPRNAAVKKTFHEPFSDNELRLLLTAPNRSTAIGNRDYAIMLLAVQTGLRACDIARIKCENINWRTKEICLVQHKTGVAISMPLPTEAGNAIAEYLLHFRPICELPYIFICHSGQRRPLNDRSPGSIISKYMKLVGLYEPTKRRSFHSLRRTFGTNLLKKETPFELIQQMLGHTQMNSMKPYLSVDELGLKRCALSLLPYEQKAVQK